MAVRADVSGLKNPRHGVYSCCQKGQTCSQDQINSGCEACMERHHRSREETNTPDMDNTRPFKATKKNTVRASVHEDEFPCKILGTCILKDGSVLLADNNNSRLKRLDSESLSITDQCTLDEEPWDVCCINEDEAVITQLSSLVFISLRPNLKVSRIVTTNHECTNICCSDSQLFVSDWSEKTVYVYNTDGSVIGNIALDPSGGNIFSDIQDLTFSENGDKMFVADFNKGLIILDRQGNVQSTHDYNEVSGAQVVSLCGSGGLLVCGFTSNNFVHVDRSGKALGEVLSRSDGLECFLSVCYDNENKRLFVTQLDRNDLLMFDIM